jgi:photosystem II stability/assembly factor-like uncharacterized protein
MVWSAPAAFALADVIETPARPTELAPDRLLNDVTQAGDRIVAVGERGHIIYSDDEGQTWTQSEVPVSVTLTGVDFGSDTQGWAVGHSGVILHSGDAGETWSLQFTGIQALELAIQTKEDQIAAMEERIEAAPEADKADLEWALDDLLFGMENMQSDLDIGPVNPLLDVWFENESRGFVVGAYGMILRTTDGGETWQDWAPRIDNATNFHLNGVTQITGGALVVVGESGQIHVSVDGGQTWERRESPYEGSLFGVIGTGQVNEILAFGLRGTMLFSSDLGKSWRVVPSTADTTLNDGAVVDDGRIILVGNSGVVLTSSNGAESFRNYFRNDREGVMSVVPVSGTGLLIVGEGGATMTDARGMNLQ